MRAFILGFIAGVVSLYGSMCFHIVRGNDGTHFVQKTALTFKDSYVDIRSFGVTEWRDHVPLAEAIMKANKSQLVEEATENAVRNAFDNLLDRRTR